MVHDHGIYQIIGLLLSRLPEVLYVTNLYGTPGKMEEIKHIADAHGALIVEDAAESLRAKYKLSGEWVETGALGQYNAISFNGNNVLERVGDIALCNKAPKIAA